LVLLVWEGLKNSDLDCNVELHLYEVPHYDIDVVQPDMFQGITLRPYQLHAVKELLSKGRGVAKMATNSGKTEVMAAMIKSLQGRALVLTTKKDLLHQTAARFENRLQEQVGKVGDNVWQAGYRVTVGMIQTLSNHLCKMKEEFADLDVVMYDECHHLPSQSSQAVMYGLDAPYRYGFSGTPLRRDKLSDLLLIGATGPVTVEVTNAELIDSGVSARPIVRMYEIGSDEWYDSPWREAYSECIVGNDVRNDLIAMLAMTAKAASTLVLVDRIAHGVALRQLIPGSVFVHGSSGMWERKEALDTLRAGRGAIVIATNIFREGVDVPAVNLLVLAGGGKGHIKLLQQLGRGMRSKEGDNVLRVIDCLDDTNRYLLNHSLERAKIYEQEGFDVEVVEQCIR
jgi:superfamily II DNA or RNA helicase